MTRNGTRVPLSPTSEQDWAGWRPFYAQFSIPMTVNKEWKNYDLARRMVSRWVFRFYRRYFSENGLARKREETTHYSTTKVDQPRLDFCSAHAWRHFTWIKKRKKSNLLLLSTACPCVSGRDACCVYYDWVCRKWTVTNCVFCHVYSTFFVFPTTGHGMVADRSVCSCSDGFFYFFYGLILEKLPSYLS